MYLENFRYRLAREWQGSLFRVSDVYRINRRAKEYLYRLSKEGYLKRIYWGWYFIPAEYKDPWEFLAGDSGFKVIIKQTAASLWNYDFVHRDVYRLAVKNRSYGKALEKFAGEMGWNFEVEYHERIPYEYRKTDGLFVETIESSIVSCISEWSFLDAFAVLYFRRDEVSLEKLKRMGRWKRISGTDTRVWTALKYGCRLFNESLGKKMFRVKIKGGLGEDVKELIQEAVAKVVESA
ncbi:MAG: hypothetical protein GXO63_03125 [Candidatus Micrarchaeota archaeon]|nr:hypothetical protein [Candidatus Micrarchaeota archaeon]